MFAALSLSGYLLMRKKNGTVLCQTRMYLLKGIIVGAVNGLQLNKWLADTRLWGRVWQLIAIFEQSKYVSGNACRPQDI